MRGANPVNAASTTKNLRRRILQYLAKGFRQRGELRIAGQRCKLRRCRHKAFTGLGVADQIVESYGARSHIADGGGDANEVVVARTGVKPKTRLDDSQRDILSLELRVRSSHCADEFGAPDLAPDQIVGVIN